MVTVFSILVNVSYFTVLSPDDVLRSPAVAIVSERKYYLAKIVIERAEQLGEPKIYVDGSGLQGENIIIYGLHTYPVRDFNE